jgi:CelD/BcsL family acetyltransferase involved in cellulose biosynthesis
MVWTLAPTVDSRVDSVGQPQVRASAGLRAAGPLSVDVTTTPEGLLSLKPAYDRLNELCRNTLPFALHEWHVAWWNHLASSGAKVVDALRILSVRDRSGDFVAIVPFVSTRRELAGLEAVSLSLLGADPNFTEIRAPLVAPGLEAPVAAAIANHLEADDGWDWVTWSGLHGPFGDALARVVPLAWDTPNRDYVLELAPSWEQMRGGLKRNIRESLRHCYNSLKRDSLEFEFEVAETPDAVRNGLHMFLSLHAMRAGLANTVSHPHRFESGVARRFLYEACDRLAERGAARVFLLKVRGCVVATRIAFVVGEQLYFYYSGFDPKWGKYSVSTTIVAEAIKYAIAQGLTSANLSTGTDVSKTRWGAELVAYREATQTRRRLKSRIAYTAFRTAFDPRFREWLSPIAAALPRRSWD